MSFASFLLVFFLITLFIFSFGNCTIIILYPTDDTYVDGRYPSENYGFYPNITFSGIDNTQRGFIKFNLTNIDKTKIKDAKFYIYANSVNLHDCWGKILFNRLNNFSLNWTEKEITYSNQPSTTREIKFYGITCCYYYGGECGISYNCNFGAEISFNVTEAIKDELINNSRNVFTFQIYVYPNSAKDCRIFSKDHPNPNYWPKLVLELEEEITTTTITTTTTIPTTTTSTTLTTSLPTTTTSTIYTTTTYPTTSTIQTSTTTIPTTIPSFKKPIILTNSNFWNILFASSLDYPVLVWNSTDEKSKHYQKIFIEEYNPDIIFTVDMNYPSELPFKRNYMINSHSFNKNGFVIVNSNRSLALLGAFIAKIKDYSLIKTDEITGEEFSKYTICTFNFSLCNLVLDNEQKLFDYILNNIQEVSHLSIANPNFDDSALSLRLNALPIPIEINESYRYTGNPEEINRDNKIYEIIEKIRNVTNQIKLKSKLGNSYAFNKTIFLSLFGIPFGAVHDPWVDDRYDISDGNVLFTDNLFGDINNDYYFDFAIGRFCCNPSQISIQIENSKNWKTTKKATIFSSYRLPKYLDLFFLDGMTEGFATEWYLRLNGFDVKRFVERRANATEKEIEEVKGIINIEDLISKAFDLIHLKNYSTKKYTLLEYDWTDIENPKPLPEFNKTSFFANKDYSSLIFHFGMGDLEKWYLPGESENYFTPYPRNYSISYDEITFNSSKIIFDEHSLSANPNSKFLGINNMVFIGSSGIVHDTYVFSPLLSFLNSLIKGKPLGVCMNDMKLNIVTNASKNLSISGKSIATSLTILSPLKLMKKEYYQKILFGNPEIIVDPFNNEEEYGIYEENGRAKLKIDFSPNYKIEDQKIIFLNPDYFLYDYGKPIIPIFRKDMEISEEIEDIEIDVKEISEFRNLTPIYLVQDQFSSEEINETGEFPENMFWVDKKDLIDNRKIISINFAPIKYFRENNQTNAKIYNATFKIIYKPYLEILRFDAENITLNEKEKFKIKILGEGKINITILIIGENFTREIEKEFNFVNREIKDVEIEWQPSSQGKFLAKVIARSNGMIAGPREKIFFVKDEIREKDWLRAIIEKFFGAFSRKRKIITQKEMLSEYFENGKSAIEYQNQTTYLKIESSAENIYNKLITPDFMLIINENSTEKSFIFTTPKGRFLKILSVGKISEICEINCDELRKEFDKALIKYNLLKIYVNDKLEFINSK